MSTPQKALERKQPDYYKGLPATKDTEKLLFGLVLTGAWSFEKMSALLRVDDFLTDDHQRIYRAMLEMQKRGVPIDPHTLGEQLTQARWLSAIGGRTYIASLAAGTPELTHPERYVEIVVKASVARGVILANNAITNRLLDRNADADEVLASGVAALQALQSRNGFHQEQWPEVLPIGSELPAVQAFQPEMLPEGLRDYVEDIAERMQVPLDYPAACLMVAMAGAINRRASIQPKSWDTSWVVIPNLWGGIIGPPGFLKSPVMQTICAPLYAQERLWQNEWEQDMESYESDKESLDLRLATWKEQTKRNLKKGTNPPIRPDTSITEPTRKRLITGDSTYEKLHELMYENPAGMLMVRDEISQWMAELDREGRQSERGFFLSAWNGDAPHNIDRIGRGSLLVPACCVSVLGCFTPGRLRSYLVDALQDGPSNDGLMQRFQVQVWPDPPCAWRYVDRAPAKNQAVHRMFERILRWDSETPAAFRFNAEAQSFFVDWMGDLQHKVRSGELHPALISHLSKYPKLMPAAALILAAADQLLTQGELYDPPVVCLHSAQQAARWCAYLESHATRIYSCVVTPAMQAAADLAAKLKAKAVGGDGKPFAVRDVYRHCWSRLDTPERVNAALNILEDAGWVRTVLPRTDPGPGRPSNLYVVNPRVHQI